MEISISPKYKLCVNEYCDDHRDLVENIRLTLKNYPTDFSIEVDDEKFPVHKLIIAMHSAYLAKLVSYGEDIPTFTTTSLRYISVNDFNTIVKWMYSGEIILKCNNVITLYAAAKVYDIPKLLTLCTMFMNSDPACAIMHVWKCMENDDPYLTKRDGIELISSLLIDAVDDPNFEHVTYDILTGILGSPNFKVDSENLTLWVILRWVSQDMPSRHMLMPEILNVIQPDKIQGSTAEEVMEKCNVNVEGMLPLFTEAMQILYAGSSSPSVGEYEGSTQTEEILTSTGTQEPITVPIPLPRKKIEKVRSQEITELETPSSYQDNKSDLVSSTKTKDTVPESAPDKQSSTESSFFSCCSLQCFKSCCGNKKAHKPDNNDYYKPPELSDVSTHDVPPGEPSASSTSLNDDKSKIPVLKTERLQQQDDVRSRRFSESSQISEDDSSAIQPIVQEDVKPVIVADEHEISSPTDMAEIVSSESTNSSKSLLPTAPSADDEVDKVAPAVRPVGHSLFNVITTVYGDTYKQETQASFAKDGNTVVTMDRQSSDPLGANLVDKMKSEISRKFRPKMISGAQALLLEMDVKCPGFAGKEGILMSMQVTVDSAMLSCDIEPQDPPRDSMVSAESEGSQNGIKPDEDQDSTNKVADADSEEIGDDVEPSTESSTSNFNYSNMLP